MNIGETPEQILVDRRIMELRILLAHSTSEIKSLALAAKLEEAKAMKMPDVDS
jgi:hypothetical protein